MKGTIIRTVVLIVALANQLLITAGHSPLPFDDAQLETVISGVFTIVASGIAWFKNNFITKKGRLQKDVLEKNNLT
jgi:SPP1 family holin